MRAGGWSNGLAALVAATATLAGCGTDDAAGPGRPAHVPAAEAIADPCRLVAADEVEQALGTPVSAGERRSSVGALGRPGCEYSFHDEAAQEATPAGGDTGRRPKAAITVLAADDLGNAARGHGQHARKPDPLLDGLGDEAFVVPPHETLVARRGAVTVVVDVGSYLHAHGPGAAEQLRRDSRELAELALERIVP